MAWLEPARDEAQALCLSCGLCCTGVWFSHVNLAAGEVAAARNAGLEVEDVDGAAHSRQCCKLHGESGCSAYDQWRPAACVEFQCQLLKDLKENRLALAAALSHVGAVKEMVGRIRSELPQSRGGLLGKRFLMRVAGQSKDDTPPGPLGASASTQLDVVALNRYYELYFRSPRTTDSTATTPVAR